VSLDIREENMMADTTYCGKDSAIFMEELLMWLSR
jgi:hypothetical protein